MYSKGYIRIFIFSRTTFQFPPLFLTFLILPCCPPLSFSFPSHIFSLISSFLPFSPFSPLYPAPPPPPNFFFSSHFSSTSDDFRRPALPLPSRPLSFSSASSYYYHYYSLLSAFTQSGNHYSRHISPR